MARLTAKEVGLARMSSAVYRDMNDSKWYWTTVGFSKPVGPFENREAAREDFRHVMGLTKHDKEKSNDERSG